VTVLAVGKRRPPQREVW